MNHFFQAVNDFATIQNFNFEGAFAKIHRVIKIDNNLTVPCHRKNPFSTVVAARRGIENMEWSNLISMSVFIPPDNCSGVMLLKTGL